MTRRMIAPALFGVLGVVVLVWLGVWQVHRLAWKTALLADIADRLAAAPVAVPADPQPDRDRYLRVAAEGAIGPGELHVYTSAPGAGVGYRVIAPLTLADGRRILLDRGFVPIADKDAPRRTGAAAVEGALDWPRETDRFTPAPDRAGNLWYARDAELVSDALGTLPVMLVAATGDGPGDPTPMPVTVNLPNDHLQYAITWFGLAVV
jgi:surfeit locus 1 family protein